MPFSYVASNQAGKIKRGTSDFGSRDSVIRSLESKGLVVISVDEVKKAESLVRLSNYLLGTISHVDKVLFTKHFSIMLKAGLTLLEAVRVLEEQASGWRFRTVIAGLRKNIERGEKLSTGLAMYPKVFSAFYINIVRSGELSGTLEQSLDRLAIQFTKEYELRARVKSALMYPTIVLVAAAFIGFFFATYVLPQVAGLFEGLVGVKLPLVTVILLKVSIFARKYTFLSFLGLIGILVFIFWFLRRKFIRPVTHLLILKMPIIRKIVKDVNLARFSLVFGTLLRSGIDITKAVEITSSVIDNIYYKRALDRMIIEVQRGIPMSEVLQKFPAIFPPVTSRMISVGEKAGKLEDVLGYLADFYELEVDTAMRNLATILEPILLLVIGGIALGMAFAILIPIYNFISAIRRI